jgi:hypothetical protein
MRPQGGVALQGQFLAGPRRVMVGARGVWRGGAIADLCLPRVRVVCRGVRSGVDAHTNPGTSIGCNRTPRCRGEAKSWPYRPRGTFAPGPGIASRAGGTGLTGRNRKGSGCAFARILRQPSSKVTTHSRFRAMHVSGLHASGLCAFTAAAPLAVLVHLRHTRVSGL